MQYGRSPTKTRSSYYRMRSDLPGAESKLYHIPKTSIPSICQPDSRWQQPLPLYYCHPKPLLCALLVAGGPLSSRPCGPPKRLTFAARQVRQYNQNFLPPDPFCTHEGRRTPFNTPSHPPPKPS
jgi:hypothetical protein